MGGKPDDITIIVAQVYEDNKGDMNIKFSNSKMIGP